VELQIMNMEKSNIKNCGVSLNCLYGLRKK
jgi:hypothetical protein